MATPMSACFSAGLSFTPSPVHNTINTMQRGQESMQQRTRDSNAVAEALQVLDDLQLLVGRGTREHDLK